MESRTARLIINIYLAIFLLYLFAPLFVMIAAAFNDSKFPTVMPWRDFTLRWFSDLWADDRLWGLGDEDGKLGAVANSVLVGLAVVVIAVPVGTLAALLLDSLRGKVRSVLYALMVAPLLVPGIIIGISTLIFWTRLGVSSGLHLSTLGQCSFICSYVMLMVLARLQRLDRSLEEAALDLGASHAQALRLIVLPYLRPSLLTAAVLSFFQSFENFNTTLFTRGGANTVTIFIASHIRTGVTPEINALGFVLISITVAAAVIYSVRRRSSRVTA
jgi:spermidine/putrescine transport system permease protein